MKLCEKCGNYVPDELLKCDKCEAPITLTKEHFLENHTIYKKRYKDYLPNLNGTIVCIFLSIASLAMTFLMIMFRSTIMILLCLIVTVLFILGAVFSNKKRLDIKKFGNDEYEKYLNSLK
jgi:hypothetical protein